MELGRVGEGRYSNCVESVNGGEIENRRPVTAGREALLLESGRLLRRELDEEHLGRRNDNSVADGEFSRKRYRKEIERIRDLN